MNALDAFEVTECLGRIAMLVVLCPPQGQNGAQSAISTSVASTKAKRHRFVVQGSAGKEQKPVDLVRRRFTGQEIFEALPSMRLVAYFDMRALQLAPSSRWRISWR